MPVAVVDYALGNLESIRRAFAHVGVEALVTSDPAALEAARAVVLPGVGAFGDAMQALRERHLVGALRGAAASGKPLIGICLGMQLLLSESEEFGRHEGLDIVPGRVRRFPAPPRASDDRITGDWKVPQVGWNRVWPDPASDGDWAGTPFEGLEPGSWLYFMHSYYAEPRDAACRLAQTSFAGVTYCSALRAGNVVAFQFHPERSAEAGLAIYRNLARAIARR